MALTRKFLTALGIEADKIDEIISAHTETVDALKEKIDNGKANANAVKSLENDLETAKQELEAANKELETFKSNNWEKKYNDLKLEYDGFKSDIEAKATKTQKANVYRNILKKVGLSENRIDTVIKVSDQIINSIDLDENGDAKDADKLEESAKTEWAEFIPTTHEKGADVSNPPANNGGEIKKPSLAAEMVAQYRNEHYGNPIKEG